MTTTTITLEQAHAAGIAAERAAYEARDAYQANPTPETATNLKKAIDDLGAATRLVRKIVRSAK